jgi:hypothetical protein
VNASLFSPLKQRKILYCCSSLKWFDLLHTILRLILRLKQGAFQVKCPCRKKCRQSLFWVYQNSKEGPACDVATWAAYYMVTRTRMRAIAFLYFSYTSPFKHTRCQRTSSCSSRIRKPSLLDLVPQRILRKVIELERISFSRTSKVACIRETSLPCLLKPFFYVSKDKMDATSTFLDIMILVGPRLVPDLSCLVGCTIGAFKESLRCTE